MRVYGVPYTDRRDYPGVWWLTVPDRRAYPTFGAV